MTAGHRRISAGAERVLAMPRTRASTLLVVLAVLAVLCVGGGGVPDKADAQPVGAAGTASAALPVVMLVDVYDTTFLVGSKYRCDPACASGPPGGGLAEDAECAKDLNNDDVTRFGLGQRREFGIVRDAGCPYPHLTAGLWQRAGMNRVVAVVHTDFSLDVEFGAAGSRLLDASDVVGAGEALDYSGAVRAAWIVEPRHMFPQTYEKAVRLRAGFDVIFTHVRELVARYPGTTHTKKHTKKHTHTHTHTERERERERDVHTHTHRYLPLLPLRHHVPQKLGTPGVPKVETAVTHCLAQGFRPPW